MNRLDPLHIPLKGVCLIEASAGTGKTHNIVSIFLRLFLERELNIDQILVVTFTNAAAEELRGRIRSRLCEAAEFFEGRLAEDPFLPEVLKRLPEQRYQSARKRIQEAISRIDEAPVFTIHGFCNRILQEFAFESGNYFDAELVGSDEDIVQEVVVDFWRKTMMSADKLMAEWLLKEWKSPGWLLGELLRFRRYLNPKILPELDANNNGFDKLKEMFKRLRYSWEKHKEEVTDLLRTSKSLDRHSYNKNVVTSTLQMIGDLVLKETPPLYLPRYFERLTQRMLKEKTRKGATPPTHSFFTTCEEFADSLKGVLLRQRVLLLKQATEFLNKEIEKRKRTHRILAFDDLLKNLSDALNGSGGRHLAERIRAKYPVAMIDEFQDTDPLQYEIFRKIYGSPQNKHSDSVFLCLIGDPKQAIYGFRGADVFAYVKARRDTGGRNIYTMDTNWRSASALVKAVNHLFSRVQSPFVYSNDIPFYPVKSAGKADTEPLCIDGERPPALRFRFLNPYALGRDAIYKGKARDMASKDCAAEIARLLHLASEGRATIGSRPLMSGDVAVLVRSHTEASIMQDALREQGVASVCLQMKSVFDTEEAAELQVILQALADPADERKMRAALATEMLGWNAHRIYKLEEDESEMEAVQDRFHRYRDIWQRRGFLTSFMALLKEEGVPVHVKSLRKGERRLTNILHLAELLHKASKKHTGIERLLSWFATQRGGDVARIERTASAAWRRRVEDEQQLRLESDENLVQIVTVHRSKGLEYPVVFVPFPWSFAPKNPRKSRGSMVCFHNPEDLTLCVDLGSENIEEHRSRERDESFSEEMRLLYVALTRARYMCVTTWGYINQTEESAMARLLDVPVGQDSEDESPSHRVYQCLREVASSSGGTIALEEACFDITPSGGQMEQKEALPGDTEQEVDLQVCTFSRRLRPDWKVSSYSSLVIGVEPYMPEYAPGDGEDEISRIDSETEVVTDPVFSFPRGTRAGECIHEIFERIDFPLATKEVLEHTAREVLARYGIDRESVPGAVRMVESVLETSLSAAEDLRLRNVTKHERINELEFYYRIDLTTRKDLLGAVRGEPLYERSIDGLDFEELRGLMCGYIDMVFRFRDQFYIIDYKTNHLGNSIEDYNHDAMKEEMLSHRYFVQLLIYTIAIHRYLRACLPSYDYDLHFGGVYYLFVRGMRPEKGPRYGVYFHRPSKDIVTRLDSAFSGVQADLT